MADGTARAAESLVLLASLQALDGQGQPPALVDRDRAKGLRQIANGLLQRAMAHLDAKVAGSGAGRSGAKLGMAGVKPS